MNYATICDMCEHYVDDPETSGDPNVPETCLAFPNGIPVEIIQKGFDHRQPFEGDDGIMFSPNEDFDLAQLEKIVDRTHME